VGLLGLGTIGSGVARLLGESRVILERRAGRPVEVRGVLVRDPSRQRGATLPPTVPLMTDWSRLLADPAISIVIETMGGTVAAREVTLAALEAGKDIVTANKALLAEHGPELFARARALGRVIAFEASVGGGIPIVHALQVGLAANQVESISAIVNGTCNFILTAMSREGMPYPAALAKAQELGFAEPDPTLDVDGTDAAHKLAILTQLGFQATVRTADVPRQGIDRLHPKDIRYAAELGHCVKLLAQARRTGRGLELRVAPRLVRLGTPLADVSGSYNAIQVVGDAVGDTLFYGRGAGAMPTASAVAADLIEVIVGRDGLLARSRQLWAQSGDRTALAGPGDVTSRFYLRFEIADRPGVLGMIAQVLGRHGISIASVIQHEPGAGEGPGASVPLVIMTHRAVEAKLASARAEIDGMSIVNEPSVCLGVEE
jgi:homoserine dehydrogenase